MDMNYDIWANAGYGEDRRRLETEGQLVEDDTFKWLCQAMHQSAGKQAELMKYRVTEEDPTSDPTSDPISISNSEDKDGSGTTRIVFAFVVAAGMMLSLS